MEATPEHHHSTAGKYYLKGCPGCRELGRVASAKRRAENPGALAKSRETNRRNKWKSYGMDPDEAQAALDAHGGHCEICGDDKPGGPGSWHIDHDHVTGAVRGVLCSRCNVGLGYFLDSPERLTAAIEYLRKVKDAQDTEN